MHVGRMVFAQVMDFFPYRRFGTCVRRYGGDKGVRTLSCRDQLLCLIFAQLTYRESLRDIESCLRGFQSKLFHVGIRNRVSRSTLAEANEQRDWRIYADIVDSSAVPGKRRIHVSSTIPCYVGEWMAEDRDSWLQLTLPVEV